MNLVGKERGFKTLSPDLFIDFLTERFGNLVGRESAVGEHNTLKNGGIASAADDFLKRRLKILEPFGFDGKSGRHGMASEAKYDAGQCFGGQVECITQMYAGNGTARTFEFSVFRRRKRDDRTVDALLQARCHQSHNTLIERGVENRKSGVMIQVNIG